MSTERTRLDHLKEATAEELWEEIRRRRTRSLADCSEDELWSELAMRPGYDVPSNRQPPRKVEK